MRKYTTLIFLATVTVTIFLNQGAVAQNSVVTVGGEVEKPLNLDAGTIKKMNHVNVKSISHADHKEHSYSGVPLYEIIRECGAIPGNQLRGKSMAKYVLVKGADGYGAVISLPEIRHGFY